MRIYDGNAWICIFTTIQLVEFDEFDEYKYIHRTFVQRIFCYELYIISMLDYSA